MTRWEPGARERLREAALTLYAEKGFAETTVGDIASRAGVTVRTFFRYFVDKREVIFDGASELLARAIAAVEGAPDDNSPMERVGAALLAVAEQIGTDRELVRVRHKVIVENPELRERDLAKSAEMSLALAAALRRQGVDSIEASLAAESGVAVFRVAFDHWLGSADQADLAKAICLVLKRLRRMSLSAAHHPTPPSSRRRR